VKLMEMGEESAQKNYRSVADRFPELLSVAEEEDQHEAMLLEAFDEERLRYVGSMVLGLNDALVELTGALAGFTLALQNTKLIATTGLITGIAASLSMAASEYLSTKSEGAEKNAVSASIYTGIAYVFTVVILIFPFLFFSNPFVALFFTLFFVVLIIFVFTFYISVAKSLPFKHRFLEMVAISIGVAVISFGIGFIVKNIFSVEI
ncbi:MAG: VIT1/CCC1 transporter family protein, partial [Oligoflexia bacterium]|nr:VIT1/CCC1 transporter family protein [Oligoflexia bacterium]